jgi:FkbM family methyltransferase
MNKFISNSQHADDYIAWQLLDKPTSGIVVEVGAFDGVHLSNSFSLEKIGWRAICIEPNPEMFHHLQKNRPLATNLNHAIVGDDAINEIVFYAEEIGVLSGCSYDENDVKKRYANRGLDYKDPQKISVPATTLTNLFEKLKIDNLDVLSIDVEGFELEVLKGLDLKKVDINLFIIEANNEDFKKGILDYFNGCLDYIYAGSNYQNLFLIKMLIFTKKRLRTFDSENYTPATQHHPKGKKFAIQAKPPHFLKSVELKKFEKSFWIF